jgi:NADH:ubiquinone oxidoreductase subunit 6 (subunit J)
MRTKENIKPLFLLQYHHANMLCLAEFLRQVSSRYALRRKKDIDPRQSKLRRWNLEAIIHDVELYRHFSSTSADLQASISLLSDVVLTLDENARDNNQHSKPDLRILRAELSCCCKDIKMQLDRLTGDVEQDIKFLSISRELSQSRNVQTLTILATVFLPLSLSAGMLSMQYRLHDLGDRLYDFVGIVVILGAIVALLLLLISMHNLGLEIEGRFRKHAWYNLWVRPSLIMSQLLGHYLVGLLMLSSFIVGMFKDVRLGGKILGWGLLAVIGTPIALVLAVTLSYLVVAMLVPGVQSSFRYLTRPFKNKEQKQQHKKTQSHSEEHRLEEGIELEVATEHI